MYIRKQHELRDQNILHALMKAHPLGTWVCHTKAGLVANHLPFLLDRGRGPHGTLLAHVARANRVWRELHDGAPSVVMFHGPQSYITPGWYPSKAVHGQVVPTWDYVVAHAHGVARAIDDGPWLADLLKRLTDTHEASQPEPWQVADAPADYIAKLQRAIVGIELPLERLEGKLKASQDEDLRDRIGTVAGLRRQACAESEAMAEWVHRAIESDQH